MLQMSRWEYCANIVYNYALRLVKLIAFLILKNEGSLQTKGFGCRDNLNPNPVW